MKIISDNKRGIHNYKVIDKYEAGISLLGWEVKSARASTVNLLNSYCFFRKGEIFCAMLNLNNICCLNVMRPEIANY
nr:SsrA-binding protein [Mycoplasmopsis caviae]